MCARRHAADDRDRPEGLADALARWDTAQSWMKPTPRPEDTGRPEEPADTESAPWSDPAALPLFSRPSSAPSSSTPPTGGSPGWRQSDGDSLPSPPSGPDSWDAVLSAEPSPSRDDDPWAAGPPSAGALGRLDDPEQELWTPPDPPASARPADGAGDRREEVDRATEPSDRSSPVDDPVWTGSTPPPGRSGPQGASESSDSSWWLGGSGPAEASAAAAWPGAGGPPGSGTSWESDASSGTGAVGSGDPAAGLGWPVGEDEPAPAPLADTGWSAVELGAAESSPTGWSPAELGSAAETGSWSSHGADRGARAEAQPATELTDDEWLAHLRGAGPEQETSSRPEWARQPIGPPSWSAPDRPASSGWSSSARNPEPDPPPSAVDSPHWTMGDGSGYPVWSDVNDPSPSSTNGSPMSQDRPKWTDPRGASRPEEWPVSRGPWSGRTENGGEPVSQQWQRGGPESASDGPAVDERWAAPAPGPSGSDAPAEGGAAAEPEAAQFGSRNADWSTGSEPSAPAESGDSAWESPSDTPAAQFGSRDTDWSTGSEDAEETTDSPASRSGAQNGDWSTDSPADDDSGWASRPDNPAVPAGSQDADWPAGAEAAQEVVDSPSGGSGSQEPDWSTGSQPAPGRRGRGRRRGGAAAAAGWRLVQWCSARGPAGCRVVERLSACAAAGRWVVQWCSARGAARGRVVERCSARGPAGCRVVQWCAAGGAHRGG